MTSVQLNNKLYIFWRPCLWTTNTVATYHISNSFFATLIPNFYGKRTRSRHDWTPLKNVFLPLFPTRFDPKMRWKEELSFGISPVLRQNDDLCYVKLSQLFNRTAVISEKQLRKKKKRISGHFKVWRCIRTSLRPIFWRYYICKREKNHD